MRRRRLEDRSPAMVLVMDLTRGDGSATGGAIAPAVHVLQEPPTRADRLPFGPVTGATALILVDTGGAEVLFLNAVELDRRPRPQSGTLSEFAAEEAALLRARSAQRLRKHRFAERFVVFTERLARAERMADIRETMLHSLADLFDVYRTAIFLRAGTEAYLRPLLEGPADGRMAQLPSSVLLHEEPRPIAIGETAPGRPFAALAPLAGPAGAVALAGVPIGRQGYMVLLERRTDRSFGGEDWFRMQVVARQLERAIQRVGQPEPGVPLPEQT